MEEALSNLKAFGDKLVRTIPEASLMIIDESGPSGDATRIDIGKGDCLIAGHLPLLGFTNFSDLVFHRRY